MSLAPGYRQLIPLCYSVGLLSMLCGSLVDRVFNVMIHLWFGNVMKSLAGVRAQLALMPAQAHQSLVLTGPGNEAS